MEIPIILPGHGMSPFTGSRRRWKASLVGRPHDEPLIRGDGMASGYKT